MNRIELFLIVLIIIVCLVYIDDSRVCLTAVVATCAYILLVPLTDYMTPEAPTPPGDYDIDTGFKFDNSDNVSEFIKRGPDHVPFTAFASKPVSSSTDQASCHSRECDDPCALNIPSSYEDSAYNTLSSDPMTGYNIDTGLTMKQQYIGQKNKTAIDGAVRATRKRFEPWFTNELDENERRVWYSEEASPIATDFWTYY